MFNTRPGARFQDPRLGYSQQLMQAGASTAPVQHWAQGLGRLGQSLVGGWLQNEAGNDRRMANQLLARALQGAQSPGDIANALNSAELEHGVEYYMPDTMPLMMGQMNWDRDDTLRADERAYRGEVREDERAWRSQQSEQDWQRQLQLFNMEQQAKIANQRPTDFDREYAYYSSIDGLTQEQALGYALGRYKTSRDPISGQVQIVDVVTGERIANAPAGLDNDAGAPPMAVPNTGYEAPAPAALPEPTPGMPDPTKATGASGTWGNIVNWGADILGLADDGLPRNETDIAGRALNELTAQISTVGAAEVPGRPSDFVRSALLQNVPTPFDLQQGDQGAINKLSTLENRLANEIVRMREILADERNYSPTQVTTTRQNLTRMEQLYSDVTGLLQAAGGAGGAVDPQEAEDLQLFNPSNSGF